MEMEREKYQYIEKAKYIQEQLVNFKTEIEDMKVSSIPSGFLWGGGVYFFTTNQPSFNIKLFRRFIKKNTYIQQASYCLFYKILISNCYALQ